MDDIHTSNTVKVTARTPPGVIRAFAGKTGQVTCVKRNEGVAQVLFPGMIQSVPILLEYLTRADDANDEDDDLKGLISKVAQATNLPPGWKNPSLCESYTEYQKLVTNRVKLTAMRT